MVMCFLLLAKCSKLVSTRVMIILSPLIVKEIKVFSIFDGLMFCFVLFTFVYAFFFVQDETDRKSNLTTKTETISKWTYYIPMYTINTQNILKAISLRL